MSSLLLLLIFGLISNTHSITWGTGAETTVRDLHREYGNIFKNGNRNAASHHWSTFLLSRAENFDTTKLDELFSGYCAVSGSPVNPSQFNRYGLTLRAVTGERMQGYMHYCCWPCLCDTRDFIKVDTHTVTTSDGIGKKQHFAVIGNPCSNKTAMLATFTTFGRETTLGTSAPDVVCTDDGRLEGATMSDNGYVIIARFFAATVVADTSALASSTTSVEPGTMVTNEAGLNFQDSVGYNSVCTERANNGYNRYDVVYFFLSFLLNNNLNQNNSFVFFGSHKPFLSIDTMFNLTLYFLLLYAFELIFLLFSPIFIMCSGMGAIFRVAAAINPVRVAVTGEDSSNNGATITTTSGETDSTTDTSSGTNTGSDSGSGSDSDSATEEDVATKKEKDAVVAASTTTKAPTTITEDYPDPETVSSDLSVSEEKSDEEQPASAGFKQSSCSWLNYAVVFVASLMIVFQGLC